VQANEGIVLVALMFFITPLAMCYPMMSSGLKDTIIPSRTISRYLQDMVGGTENFALSPVIKDEARFFTLIAKEEDAVAVKDLKWPADAKVICYYREGTFSHADEKTTFRIGDEVVIKTHSKNMPALKERWQPKPAQEEAANSSSKKTSSRI
jgi:trk system potassium uptake protein